MSISRVTLYRHIKEYEM
nr:hypothetical protein [Clostridium estertheticum]